MAIRRRTPRGGIITTKIPVNNLNSVATSAANKRQPNEAEALDNVLVSLERGIEKRPGFEVVPQDTIAGLTGWNFANNNTKFNLYNLPSNHDLFYYWYSINTDNTYLVVIDYDATGAVEKLFYIFKLKPDNTWTEVTPQNQWDGTDASIPTTYTAGNANSEVVEAYRIANSIANYSTALNSGVVNKDSRTYITYGTGTKTAKESLKAVSLGANIVVLNTNVSAGFSSDTDGQLFGLNGVKLAGAGNEDIEGRRVTYYTAAKVARVYSAGEDGRIQTTDDILLGWRPATVIGLVGSAGANNTPDIHVHLDASASAIDDAYNGSTITIGAQTKLISDYIGGTTKKAILSATTGNWSPIPAVGTAYSISLKGAEYIAVEDYFYYDTTKECLGQKVNDLSDIQLPPDQLDWIGNNSQLTSGDNKAQLMLKSLYDVDTEFASVINGRGKIYFTVSPYLNTTSGYYRVISWNPGDGVLYNSGTTVSTTSIAGYSTLTSLGRPYLQKIRTPDEHSYLDPKRMPQRLKVTVEAGAVTKWSLEKIKWTPRTSGTKESNPGPSIFKTIDKKDLRQIPIKSISVFKDRLWFAVDDVVFSSQMGEYENLFLDDPTNIVTTDPIDVRVSSNNYAEITNMVPFEDYLFIDTKANTQFQLAPASGTELSPTNVAIAPVTFYSTSTIANPQLIGSRLYFFGPQRLYLFVGKNAMGYSSAVETSAPAAGYLPTNYRIICTAPAQDSIVMVNDDNPNELYFYTSRFSAERVIQSSFYRYLLDQNIYDIRAIQSYGNYLYAVAYIATIGASGSYVLLRTRLMNEAIDVPRLDSLIKIKLKRSDTSPATAYPNVTYDSDTGITTFKFPDLGYPAGDNLLPISCRLVLDSTWGAQAGTVLQPVSKSADPAGFVEVDILGDYRPPADGSIRNVYFGISFEMKITLSTLFVRDENNNIIDGVLNIRNGVFRHFNTGNYDVEVSHRGRTPLVSKFSAQMVDLALSEDTMPLETTDNQGEFVAKIFGYSDSTVISLVSTYTTPCNITNMEFKGKFKQKYTTLP